MYANMTKRLKKIMTALDKLNKTSKAIIKFGTLGSLLLLALGTALVILNHTVLKYNSDFEFMALSVVKNSFVILAEMIIGALALDFVFSKK